MRLAKTPASRLAEFAAMPERILVGLMSGTSVDGIDAAVVRVSGSGRGLRVELLAAQTTPFEPGLRQIILDLAADIGLVSTVSRVHVAIADAFADAAVKLVASAGLDISQIDAVGSHGQTVSHTPGATPSSTLQLGSGPTLAARLGTIVVHDFRAADMAAGGQGAPLVPYVDWCLLGHETRSRAVQNIGGIGNVTYLPGGVDTLDSVRGFDTGPGNLLIDRAASWATDGAWGFDHDGCLAAGGTVDTALLEWLAGHPFLAKPPPKSAGREEFGAAFFESVREQWGHRGGRSGARSADLVATLTRFTAMSIADAYDRFLPALPDEVIVGGGGACNPTLMRMLAEQLTPIPVSTHAPFGIDGDAKEAIAFALLASETLLGVPANVPSVTGASARVLLGTVAFP